MSFRLNVRQIAEEREESLSPYAVKSKLSLGRLKPEEPCPVRTAFQRDRDRIIHSKAFRRLKHKTQVFIAPLGDHYVTRLTHTVEVSQIARTISRALNLNEDLTEAIALAHDLGHTPFGHVGEEVLNELYHRGFRHNEQSLRVVDRLEKNGQGLNLTWEVRDGILNHSKTRVDILGEGWGKVNTLEGEVCKIADTIAYINHDIGDAIRAGIITEDDLPPSAITVLGQSHSQRINTMVCDVIDYSWSARGYNIINRSSKKGILKGLRPFKINSSPSPFQGEGDKGGEVFRQPLNTPTIGMSPQIREATNILREFLFERVYNLRSVQDEAEKAREVVRSLYHYFIKHEDELPLEYRFYSDETEQRVVDYIAGMTDQYALRLAEELSLIKGGER
ncbi:deoxyguanosinetriphosphate triphosphohydrolase [Dehalococcoidales bacterium]|nr:deoxyguanosinetriphosphate triphosphohydrolase [Dehalococcoidales bacterium]